MVINGTTTTYAYDSNVANEYTQVVAGGVTHTPLYDDAGNITRDAQGYYHSYDYENRLAGVQNEAQYSYDALGRRIEFIDSEAGVTKRYYYDGWRVLSETDGDGVWKRDYVYGNYLDEVLVKVEDTASTDDLYYAHDHLFSPVALIDDDGDVVERYEYDAYGACKFMNANFASLSPQKSTYGSNKLFTGKEWDILDGCSLRLQNSIYRIYSIDLGRFLQRDILGIADGIYITEYTTAGSPKLPRNFDPDKQYTDGLCLYEYVKSNPSKTTDVYGLICGCVVKQARGCDHRYISCGGKVWGFDGTGSIHREDWTPIVDEWDLDRQRSGIMQGISRLGKPINCACATCKDIKDCINYYSEYIENIKQPYCSNQEDNGFIVGGIQDLTGTGSGYVCRTFVRNAASMCCLVEKRITPFNRLLASSY